MSGFPQGFIWGAASSSYQIEGGANEGGRGLSVWDTFCRQPGFTYGGHTGEVACDAYHRYDKDCRLMGELGIGAYRFSISWPRVLPQGIGQPSETGLDYYDRLVDSLLTHNVQPWVTLFHWDYPQALFDRGGWFNPDSPKWFDDYTRLMVDRLSDRVAHWFTLNEPQCYIGMGHVVGTHAPGCQLERKQALLAFYHSLLAHGLAVQTIRQHSKRPAQVGYAPCGAVFFPKDPDNPDDVEAARRRMFDVDDDEWYWSVSWFVDPVALGTLTPVGVERMRADLPKITDDDLKTMCQPLDFFGFNLYNGRPVTMDDRGEPTISRFPRGYPQTMMGWPITPESIRWAMRFLYERYKLPIIITENGLASMDHVHSDGKVHDAARIDFLTRYLLAMREAISAGADLRGYFQWSFMDNFEWAEGYSRRFGLVYVDYETLERIPKDSFEWYKQVVATNGGCLPASVAPLR